MEWWQNIGNYWWVIFPLAGIVGGWIKTAAKFDERRRRDKIELERVRQQGALADRERDERAAATQQARTDEVERLLARHAEVNRAWLDYELDVGKLIDFPLMTDMREERTVRFHRAKRVADALRPDRPEELADPARLAEYRAAVIDFESTFHEAETEAKRRRSGDFSESERRSLDRARQLMRLAADEAATPAERQSAYRRARKELEGLIVLPERTIMSIEHRIAGALEGRGGTHGGGSADQVGR